MTEAKSPEASAMDCADPRIPMGEWRERCADGPDDSPDGRGPVGAPSATGASGTPSSSSAPVFPPTAAPTVTAPTGASSAAPTGATGPKTAAVGDTISLSGYEGEKIDVTVVKVVDPAQPTSDYSFAKPKDGMRFVAVQWRVANTGSTVSESGPTTGSTLADARGQEFRSTYAETTAGVPYSSGTKVQPGQSRLGVVVYEVPLDSKIVAIEFGANSGFADETGQWTIP
ncbi:DUF4352 domain-containing protein [Yinghuangia sp. YIM S09857]|uniref:DUF4352 domain-containing protein n=1 Tax=Yinghuangia sp. YIM S09857 TaxID=3436929 RepID=UPI003F53410B